VSTGVQLAASLNPIGLRTFGKTGLRVNGLGFGGANIGWADVSDKVLDRIFGRALELGINVIDTAAMYGDSEEKIGRTLRDNRGKFLLFTKCGRSLPPRFSRTGFLLRAGGKLRRTLHLQEEYESSSWNPRALQHNIDQSLRRLKTTWLDLLQLHSCSKETLEKDEVLTVLRKSREQGKTRFIGYSGEGAAALCAIQSGQFQAIQMSINIADQDNLNTLLPLATQSGMGVIAKRPLANGLWKSAVRPDPFRYPHFQVYWERLRHLQYDFLSGDHAVETALRFPLSVPGVHTVIVGITNPEHLNQNAEYFAAGVLEKAQFDSIRSTWSSVAGADWFGQV
jgi:aryl-alcohol dehydrogenase-like predicted oxidoreductase